ncbi:zinc finger protein 208-like [Ochlerotatus camptorhynchus]|uniref:zinc finger protein 208-like n=1 Tax=Ochlerotatus camptorhynchus TaxID=644619 RepID=UPI0031DF2C17
METTKKAPQSPSFASECRFCGTYSNVIVDLFKNGLAQKAEKSFYLAIEPTDYLPKFICKECESSLCAAYAFGAKTRLVEKELRRKYCPPVEDYMTVEYLEEETPFEYLTYESDPVGLALEKLKTTSIVIKKISHQEHRKVSQFEPVVAAVEDQKESSPQPLKKHKRYEAETVIKLIEPVPCICLGCSGRFSCVDELLKHKNECNPNSYTCLKCSSVFENQLALKRHQQKHYSYVYRYGCPSCDKIFKNSFDLDNHRARDHGEEVEELGYAYRCCNQEFQTRKALHEHAACHKEDPVLCAVCGRSYKNKATLMWHQKIHSDYRPWVCEVCGVGFRKRANLFQHRQQHTGVKLFKCDQCPKQYGKKDSLKKHYRKCHSTEPIMWSQTGEKLGLTRKRVAQDHSYEGPPPVVKDAPENDDVGREEEVNDE